MIVFFASVHKRFFIPELNLQSFTYICIGTSIVNFIIEMIWNIHHTDGVSNVYRGKSCHHHNNLQIHVKSWPTKNTSQKFLLIWGLSLRGRCPYLLWDVTQSIWFQLVCNWWFPCARLGQRSLHCSIGRVTVRTQGFCTAHSPWLV